MVLGGVCWRWVVCAGAARRYTSTVPVRGLATPVATAVLEHRGFGTPTAAGPVASRRSVSHSVCVLLLLLVVVKLRPGLRGPTAVVTLFFKASKRLKRCCDGLVWHTMSESPLLRNNAPSTLLPWGEWDRPDGLETLSNLQCFAVFVNAIIGTGVFALPFAVHRAGWMLSLIVLVVCAFFGWLTAGWTIESCARAGAMVRVPPQPDADRAGPEPALSLNAGAGDRRRGKTEVAALATGINDSHLMLGWERTDFSKLARLFLGRWGQRALLWLTAAQCYTVLWAYTSVFSSSAAGIVFEYGGLQNGRCVQPLDDPSNAPACTMVYYICVLCFAAIVVPLTLLEIEEQANVQLALTAYRFLALGVMIATLGVAMSRTDNFKVATFEPALDKVRICHFTSTLQFTTPMDRWTQSAGLRHRD